MKKKLKVFSIKYFLLLVILITIIFLIIQPRYLYNNNEFIKTDYYRYSPVDLFKFLPENPYFDVVYLSSLKASKQKYGVNVFYYKFETEKLIQAEFPCYSINDEFGGFSDLYFDEEEKTIETIFTTNGADYYLTELYNPNNNFIPKSQKIFRYLLYDELQSKMIEIRNIKIYPSSFKENNNKNIIITKHKDGFKFSFNTETIRGFYNISMDEIKDNELYLSISEEIQKALGISFSPEEIFEIKQFLLRNSYYRKTFFSNPDFDEEGFLGAKIVGKIDSNNDGFKEYLIHVRGSRFIDTKLLCYDKINDKIVWERHFIYGITGNLKIIDIDNDGIDEILFTTNAHCNEPAIDYFKNKAMNELCRSSFNILDNTGEFKILNNKPAKVELEVGLNQLEFLFISEQQKVLLGFNSSSEKLEKNLLLYDLKENKVKESDIKYNNILNFTFEDKNLIAYDSHKWNLKKIVISPNFDVKKIHTLKFRIKPSNPISEKICIDNKKYSVIGSPLSIINNKHNLLYTSSYSISSSTYHIKQNELYFKEKYENRTYLSQLTFSRNYKLNPYTIIIFLTELLLFFFYFLIKQYINIPLKSSTSSYFIVYKIFGKLYFWKLVGRLTKIYPLPKKMSSEKETPNKILNDISEENELIYQKNFFLLKYKVYEISSSDEFPIIQRISHDLKNQVLLTKLMTEQYEKDLIIKNAEFLKNMSSSLKEISLSAKTLSDFSHINKLYKEKVGIKTFIESVISQYVNHPLFEKIELVKQNSISIEIIEVDIDKSLFQIAFKNLLNNALEAIDENGFVKIDLYKENDDVVIEMRNNLSQFSTRTSFQVESCLEIGYSTKEIGSGLGVPISKTIIEKHGGTFEIKIIDTEFIVKISLIVCIH